jgi:hypothetical protein
MTAAAAAHVAAAAAAAAASAASSLHVHCQLHFPESESQEDLLADVMAAAPSPAVGLVTLITAALDTHRVLVQQRLTPLIVSGFCCQRPEYVVLVLLTLTCIRSTLASGQQVVVCLREQTSSTGRNRTWYMYRC